MNALIGIVAVVGAALIIAGVVCLLEFVFGRPDDWDDDGYGW